MQCLSYAYGNWGEAFRRRGGSHEMDFLEVGGGGRRNKKEWNGLNTLVVEYFRSTATHIVHFVNSQVVEGTTISGAQPPTIPYGSNTINQQSSTRNPSQSIVFNLRRGVTRQAQQTATNSVATTKESTLKPSIRHNKRGINGEARLAVTIHEEGEVGVCFKNYIIEGRECSLRFSFTRMTTFLNMEYVST